MIGKNIFTVAILLTIVIFSSPIAANGYYGYPMPPAYGYAPQPYYQGYTPYPYGQPRYNQPPARYFTPQHQQPVRPAEPEAKKPEPEVKATPVITEKPVSKPVTKSISNKQAFIDQLLPIIKKANQDIKNQRNWLISVSAKLDNGLAIGTEDQSTLKRLSKAYRVKDNVLNDAATRIELLSKIDVIPASLTLAQAANESAWGKSRFAREANNLFGIWTYDESKGLLPKNREAGKKHFVRKFDSIEASVIYYMQMLNSHPAYAKLREIRQELRQQGKIIVGSKLAGGLEKYSAKGDKYISLIRQLITQNEWLSHDKAVTSV